jgi:ParB family transcriptional regulator, chromosome partitioning protein
MTVDKQAKENAGNNAKNTGQNKSAPNTANTSMPKKGLGKGLGALLSGIGHDDESGSTSNSNSNKSSSSDLVYIACQSIIANPHQPRRIFNEQELQELALSIRQHGILQPIVVKFIDNDTYQIIAGERRWRAAQIAKLVSIPCVIKNVSVSEQSIIALIENIQRKELNAIEEAQAFQRLKEEFNLTHDQIAEQVGKSRSHISNTMRLLNLAEAVQDMLSRQLIEMGHARALLSQDKAQQVALAHMITQNNWSVRDIEKHIQAHKNSYTKDIDVDFEMQDSNNVDALNTNNNAQANISNQTQKPKLDQDIQNLELNLSEILGADVAIKAKLKSGKHTGRGEIVIQYASLDILDGILKKILPQ